MDNLVRSYSAGADLSAKKGYAVKLNGSRANRTPVAILAGANEGAIGIITEPGIENGDRISVCVHGFCFAKLGGTVDEGNALKVDANGALVAATPSEDDVIIARVEQGGVSGDIVQVFVNAYKD